MGQYWTFKNINKHQQLCTFAFGSGLKYLEQWFHGGIFSGLMVLLTDTSSLGHGGGDFRLENVPEELKNFITPVIGSWAGDRIVFSGDYTKNEEYNEDNNFEDISDKAALAVWTMVAYDIMGKDEIDHVKFKIDLCNFLKKNANSYKEWETDKNINKLLLEINKLFVCKNEKKRNGEENDNFSQKKSRD